MNATVIALSVVMVVLIICLARERSRRMEYEKIMFNVRELLGGPSKDENEQNVLRRKIYNVLLFSVFNKISLKFIKKARIELDDLVSGMLADKKS